jgi:hypothetical protein
MSQREMQLAEHIFPLTVQKDGKKKHLQKHLEYLSEVQQILAFACWKRKRLK